MESETEKLTKARQKLNLFTEDFIDKFFNTFQKLVDYGFVDDYEVNHVIKVMKKLKD